MKVTGLLLIALSVVALAQPAPQDYVLRCTPNEMGIRWPSYKSHSEYYVCHRQGDRPMTVPCNSGEVFSFVLQICASPSRYIPAPALEILPTDSTFTALTEHKPDVTKPLEIGNVFHPPVLSESDHHEHPPMVPHTPPVVTVDAPKPPTLAVVEHNTEPEEHTNHEQASHELANPHKPAFKPPMPPTPAPTPPVVSIETDETSKKPQASHPKKPAKPSKTPVKPSKADDKKPADTKAEKKSPKHTPKKPTNTNVEKKAPKKTPKKPTSPVKKSPKAPIKS